ncbi:MAG: hypothetical protein V2I34_04330 [Bacteroidales bacterium]|jgi:hypothetical protein|nr:hypothetical protein [Bacteroidales bacterium]
MAKKDTKKEKIKDKVKSESEKIKENAEEKLGDVKEKAEEVKAEFEESAEDVKENLRQAGESVSESGFWEETGENISEGARIAGEEARKVGEKISAYSERLFGKIKDKSSEAFRSGLDLTKEGVNRAQAAADRLKDNIEVSRLNRQKKEVATQLGMKFYLEVKNNDNKVPENILRKRVFVSLLKELENIDKQILDIENE